MNQPTVRFERELPVRHRVDVMVAGGGPAGVAAALAAARQGARVLLIDAQICLGGMGTSAGVPMFCNFTDGKHFVAGGIGQEVHDRLFAAKGVAGFNKPGDSTLYFRPEALKVVYDDLLAESPVECVLQTQLLGVCCECGYVRHAICVGKSGLYAVEARAFVDATGDGDLCALAGAPYEKGDAGGGMQPGTLVSYWSNIDWERANAAGNGLWKQDGRLREAIRDGVFTVRDPGMPGIIPNSPTAGNGNIGHLFGVDGTDERSITQAAIRGRKMVREYERYFKEYLTGYERMELITTAAVIGIRETRRILGDYVLNQSDYYARAIFPDEIGRFCYGIDLHATTPEDMGDSAELHATFLGIGESYGIPYRILTPQKLENVLVAGRCVSTDRSVQGSLRVMPGCFITGQAAGIAAALTAQRNTPTRGVNLCDLQQRLCQLGAYLPNLSAESAPIR